MATHAAINRQNVRCTIFYSDKQRAKRPFSGADVEKCSASLRELDEVDDLRAEQTPFGVVAEYIVGPMNQPLIIFTRGIYEIVIAAPIREDHSVAAPGDFRCFELGQFAAICFRERASRTKRTQSALAER